MIYSNREGSSPNPLRPYSVPGAYAGPSVLSMSTSTSTSSTTPAPPPVMTPRRPTVATPSSSHQNAAGRYASKARDMLQDLDYDGYLSGGGGGGGGNDGALGTTVAAVRDIRAVADDLMWKYTSVLMAQPFEMAKAVLQVRCVEEVAEEEAVDTKQPNGSLRDHNDAENDDEDDPVVSTFSRRDSQRPSMYDVDSSQVWSAPPDNSDSENDEVSYFSNPTTPSLSSRRGPPGRRSSTLSRQNTTPQQPKPTQYPLPINVHHLELVRPGSILEVMNQLWQKEGPFGVWKGSNATFVYSVLQSLVENWSRSLLSALVNVPDVGISGAGVSEIDLAAPYPWASFVVAAAAAAVAAVVLAPLDLVRTRLMLSPSSLPPRRTLTLLQALPSYACPAPLLVPTVLNALVHPLLTLATPLVVRSQLSMLDHRHQLSPMTFSVVKFVASSACLFVKLPIETVLRRGQVAFIRQQSASHGQSLLFPKPLHKKDSDNRRRAPARPTTAPPSSPRVDPESFPFETVVPTGRYAGVLGTMYNIIWEEGSRRIKAPGAPLQKPSVGAARNRRRPTMTTTTTATTTGNKTAPADTIQVKGQGLEGLWRGWRVSWWGLLGLWVSTVVSNGGDGEF